MTFQLGDVHLYDRHFECAKQFIANAEFEAPDFWIGDSLQTLEDAEFNKTFGLKNYKNEIGNCGKIPSEVSVTIAELERMGISPK